MMTRVLFVLVALQAGSVLSYSYGLHNSLDDNGHSIKYYGPTVVPYVLKDGHIADTHEVAAARAKHFAAVAKVKSYGGYGHAGNYGSHGYASSYGHKYSYDNHGHLLYHGPTAIPHVLKNGHIADTHEVAAARAEHFAALAKAKSYGGYGYGEDYGSHGYASNYGHKYSYDNHGHLLYHGPTAIPHVLKNGHIADTHEVAVAKAEHLAAVAKAKTHGYYYATGYKSASSGGYHDDYTSGYHGPLAKPVVLKSGYLADTHEVAAAKEHHLHALHNAAYHGHYAHHY